MIPSAARRSHEEFARTLRRAGYSDELISDVLSQLPDPIDLERDQQVLARRVGTALGVQPSKRG
ncbi:MAG: hypothetical protein JO243_13625 [Solirubrobacterales bacterium]|nr:hypothetical protein [Solirubrobacterales bacterium]